MCAVALFNQKAMFKAWAFEFDCRFRKFGACPLNDVLDKTIWAFPGGRESGSLIGRKTHQQKKESYKIATGGSKDYVVIYKKWLFDILELHYKLSNGEVADGLRMHIKNANRIAQLEIGGCGKNPEWICEWLLGKK